MRDVGSLSCVGVIYGCVCGVFHVFLMCDLMSKVMLMCAPPLGGGGSPPPSPPPTPPSILADPREGGGLTSEALCSGSRCG